MGNPLLGESMKGISFIFWWFLKRIHDDIPLKTFIHGGFSIAMIDDTGGQ